MVVGRGGIVNSPSPFLFCAMYKLSNMCIHGGVCKKGFQDTQFCLLLICFLQPYSFLFTFPFNRRDNYISNCSFENITLKFSFQRSEDFYFFKSEIVKFNSRIYFRRNLMCVILSHNL